MTVPELKRFERKFVVAEHGCWIWSGNRKAAGGYGRFALHRDGKQVHLQAHRVAYEHYIGPIPDGLQIDHLCRTPSCVNPEHLEPVTARENTLRGTTITAANLLKTHCSNGHEFTTDNTYMWAQKNGQQHRQCRTCVARLVAVYRSKNRRALLDRENEARRLKRAELKASKR